MGTFTIIKTDKRAGDIEEFNRINKIYSRWLYQFHSHVCRLNDKFQAGITGNNHDYNCISFSGAKCIALKHDYRRLTKKLGIERGDNHEDVKQDFEEIENLLVFVEHMTFHDFINTFPITKTYDGNKWECKDYFYTMDELRKFNMDNRIGYEKIRKLLWDYQNPLIHDLCIEFMTTVNELQKLQGEKTLTDGLFDILNGKDPEDKKRFTVIKGGD